MEFSSQHNTASAAWPKKALLPCGLALLAVLGLGAILIWSQSDKKNAKASSKTSGPLLITPAQQHLGKLNQFEKKHFSFTIKNQGNEPLRIVKVEHSCGCTEAKASKEVIAPGETAKISGTLDAEKRVGEFGSAILITYQIGRESEKQLEALVGGKAVTLIKFPDHIDLGAMTFNHKPKSTTIKVSKGESDLAWDNLQIFSTKVVIETTQISPLLWEITLTPPEEGIVGSFRENISYRVSHKENNMNTATEAFSTSWKVGSENFLVSPRQVLLNKNAVSYLKISSLNNRQTIINKIEYPVGSPFSYKQFKDKGELFLQFQVVDKKITHLWSGFLKLTISDGLKQEVHSVLVIRN